MGRLYGVVRQHWWPCSLADRVALPPKVASPRLPYPETLFCAHPATVGSSILPPCPSRRLIDTDHRRLAYQQPSRPNGS